MEGPRMRNATAIGLIALLVAIIGAAAFQLLIALG
jgi:hypothetical protein